MTASDVLAKAYLESREEVLPVWAKIDETVMANHERVLDSFISERVALHHMSGTTGYGYGDAAGTLWTGSRVFGAQDRLVAPLGLHTCSENGSIALLRLRRCRYRHPMTHCLVMERAASRVSA